MVDIWAMGVLLYFMLVGVTPFRGETLNDLTQNILKG
uniref:Protein kinase domain-containing protein n=2 Tax=Ascarididae TaxID=6250 RepID=A0A914RTH0_PAREQ